MGMISSFSHGEAKRKLGRLVPSDLYLRAQNLPSRERLFDLLIIESDGEWWFNSDSIDKQLKLDGLTEVQVEVKLFTGYSHCPKCNHDLATITPALPGQPIIYGFYDYDCDPVRIQHQFACRKCRHQWGPPASGPRNADIISVPAAARVTQPQGVINEPKPGTAGAAAFATADAVYARPDRPQDWKAFRLVVIAEGEAEGQNPGNVGTELPRWARFRKVFHFAGT